MQSAVIDTFIGLAFLFFLVAVFSSAIVEFIGNLFRKRAKYLLRTLRDMLEGTTPASADGGLKARVDRSVGNGGSERALYRDALTPRDDDHRTTIRVMAHPLVEALKQTNERGEVTRNPSYVPATTFAVALLDVLLPGPRGDDALAQLRARVTSADAGLPSSLQDALTSLIDSARGDLDAFMAGLEHWYDAQMERVSGSYKRWAKRWIIVFSLTAAVFLHVDAIGVGLTLYQDEPLRKAVVAAATNGTLCEEPAGSSDTGTAGPTPEQTRACVDAQLTELGATGLPVGTQRWKPEFNGDWRTGDGANGFQHWAYLLLGLAITAWAAAFGAPFWFDALNKLGTLRNSGGKPTPLTG